MAGWTLISESAPARGAWNMAVDEALFRRAEGDGAPGPFLRLYAWSPACLSLGHHQSFSEACDPGYCASRGFDVVRRPTGGKAVLHDDEVTYSVVGRMDRPPFAGLSLIDTYGLIAEALAEGLRRGGLEVSLSQRRGSLSPAGGAPCFLVPSEKEITASGRKVVGSAQRRGQRAFLQHGAVPLHLDYEALALASAQPLADAEGYRRAFAGVADLRPGLTHEGLGAALADGFRARFEGPWTERALDAEERELAERLRRERYETDEWNLGAALRSPEDSEQMTGGGLSCSS
jgi:lipoyl(octanoyl) transferase